ncbi:MAG: High-affinity nickel-transporter [Hamadaea sp.]|nr:High-affinity nickel-transporter [Hamadaea sp.]
MLMVAGAVAAAAVAVLTAPAPAHAHPLGQFSVNQAVELTVRPDGIDASAVVDLAELPTLAAKPTASAARTCADLAAALTATIGGTRVAWQVGDARLAYTPGVSGLETSRVDCALRAAITLGPGATVMVVNEYLPERIGWRELTAIGAGLAVSADVPATSPTRGLRSYPEDLLASPLDQRRAIILIGTSGAGPAVAAPVTAAKTSWTARAEGVLGDLTGREQITFGGALLAVGLAALLGASHAALPGHGKTVMAAYLAGRSGRRRDALTVGATVTVTHTVGVLVLGLLITGAAGLAGERVLRWLGIASGVLVVVVGLALLVRSGHHHHHHDHGHDHGGTPDAPARGDRLSIAGLGVAGGLVPSPTALVVLLAAIGLDRGAFGVALVLAYGAGMAAALTAAGLLLLELRRRGVARFTRPGTWPRLGPWLHRARHALPKATAVVIVGGGIVILLRALA